MPTAKKARPQRRDLLAGIWRSQGDWSNIEYCVTGREPRYAVKVRDFEDGEKADVFEVSFDTAKNVLAFAAHWNSTGRFMRCRLKAITTTQVDLTYTYTEMTVLTRHSTKNA